MLLAVDTGGTKTLIGGFSNDGKLQFTQKFPTPKKVENYLEALRHNLALIHAKTPIDAVGIAAPGIIKDNVITWGGGNLGKQGWLDVDIPSALADVLPNVPVLVENDANLGGLGETRLLNPVPESSLYVTISTGIGTGAITNGQLDAGMRHSEGGHALVEYDGVVRMWESFASGQAIYKAYGKYGKDIHSKKTWYQVADRMSRGFLAIIPFMQPDIIIIGGSMGTHFDKYSADLIGILQERLPEYINCPTLIKAAHPEEAVLYGCYYYVIDTLSDD